MVWVKKHWFWITGILATCSFCGFLGWFLWPLCVESEPLALGQLFRYMWTQGLALSWGMKVVSILLFIAQFVFVGTLVEMARADTFQ